MILADMKGRNINDATHYTSKENIRWIRRNCPPKPFTTNGNI